jgi:TonB family protein
MGGARQGGSEGGSGGLQLAAADGGRSQRGGPGSQHGQLVGGDAPINASFESAEISKPAMQLAAASSGSARLLEDRYTATAVKVASPTHFCQIPLMMAGLGGPIPKELDSIMPSSSAMGGELPPQHLPGNQMPVYPLGAMGGDLHGRVTLRAEVLTSGAVGKILVRQSSGAQILDAAAYETVHRWRFQPAQRNGQPVVAWMTVPIEYRKPQTLNGVNP